MDPIRLRPNRGRREHEHVTEIVGVGRAEARARERILDRAVHTAGDRRADARAEAGRVDVAGVAQEVMPDSRKLEL